MSEKKKEQDVTKIEQAEIEPLSDESLDSVDGGRVLVDADSDDCPSDGCPSDGCPSDGCPSDGCPTKIDRL